MVKNKQAIDINCCIMCLLEIVYIIYKMVVLHSTYNNIYMYIILFYYSIIFKMHKYEYCIS